MAHEIVVPEVGEAGMEVTFARWLKDEGEHVREGEPLFELDTDKSTVEVEAFAEGHLAGVRVSEGEVVEPRQVVAVLLAPGEEPPEPDVPVEEESAEADAGSIPAEGNVSDGASERRAPATDRDETRRASPRARRLARQRGVDLSEIEGSGPDGQVTERDVTGAAQDRGGTGRPQDPQE